MLVISEGVPQESIIIIVVVVILTVVLIIMVLLGTCWYYRRQKEEPTKPSVSRVPRSGDGGLSSLEQPGTFHAEPNDYEIAPSAPRLP